MQKNQDNKFERNNKNRKMVGNQKKFDKEQKDNKQWEKGNRFQNKNQQGPYKKNGEMNQYYQKNEDTAIPMEIAKEAKEFIPGQPFLPKDEQFS